MAPCPVCREKFSALSRKFKVDEQCEKLCAFIVKSCPCKTSFKLSEHREHVAKCEAHKEFRDAAAKAVEEAKRREEERKMSTAVAAATSTQKFDEQRRWGRTFHARVSCARAVSDTFTSVKVSRGTS